MIWWQIDTDISNWVLSSEENLIAFILCEDIAKHTEKRAISLEDRNNDIQLQAQHFENSLSVFWSNIEKNQMLYSSHRSHAGEYNMNIRFQPIREVGINQSYNDIICYMVILYDLLYCDTLWFVIWWYSLMYDRSSCQTLRMQPTQCSLSSWLGSSWRMV